MAGILSIHDRHFKYDEVHFLENGLYFFTRVELKDQFLGHEKGKKFEFVVADYEAGRFKFANDVETISFDVVKLE